MNYFDKKLSTTENNFVKSQQRVLKSMFGRDDLLPLWIADMDFEVAPCIKNALQEMVERGVFSYEFQPDDLPEIMANWYKKRHQLELNAKCFIYAPSVLSAIALVLQGFTKESAGVVIQTPVYHMFETLVKKNNRKVVTNPLLLNDGKYEMDLVQLEQQIIKEDVKLMILCNPHNPTGRVWTKAELRDLIEVLKKHEVLLLSDEIHADIIYQNNKFTSTSVFDYQNQLVLLGSPAKSFGMQGVANGFIYAENLNYKKRLKQVTEMLAIDHGNALTAYATKAAYEEGAGWVDELLKYLQKTIIWVDEFLTKELPQVKMVAPEGTYLLWLDFRELGLTDKELNQLIIDDAKLALGKGTVFGKEGEGFMRMTIASPLPVIQQAFIQLKSAINHIK